MKLYSIDGEDYSFETEEEAAQAGFEATEDVESVTVYSGDAIKFKISDFLRLPYLIERLQEIAYEEIGDYAEGYLDDISIDQQQELKSSIINVLNEWADTHKKQPNFYKIINVTEKEITDSSLYE